MNLNGVRPLDASEAPDPFAWQRVRTGGLNRHSVTVVGAVGEEMTRSWLHATTVFAGSVCRAPRTEPQAGIHQNRVIFAYFGGMRSCTRSGCREVSHVALAFQYSTSTIWIDYLADERLSNVYELCAKHWQRFAPPSGWSLDDRRRAEVLPFVHRLAG